MNRRKSPKLILSL